MTETSLGFVSFLTRFCFCWTESYFLFSYSSLFQLLSNMFQFSQFFYIFQLYWERSDKEKYFSDTSRTNCFLILFGCFPVLKTNEFYHFGHINKSFSVFTEYKGKILQDHFYTRKELDIQWKFIGTKHKRYHLQQQQSKKKIEF